MSVTDDMLFAVLPQIPDIMIRVRFILGVPKAREARFQRHAEATLVVERTRMNINNSITYFEGGCLFSTETGLIRLTLVLPVSESSHVSFGSFRLDNIKLLHHLDYQFCVSFVKQTLSLLLGTHATFTFFYSLVANFPY